MSRTGETVSYPAANYKAKHLFFTASLTLSPTERSGPRKRLVGVTAKRHHARAAVCWLRDLATRDFQARAQCGLE